MVFYYCQTGVHAAMLTAGLHLGIIPEDPTEGLRKMFEMQYFDVYPEGLEKGAPIFVGEDDDHNMVYTLSLPRERLLGPKVIRSLMRVFNIPRDSVLLVDALKYATPALKLGAFASLTLGWKTPGRWLLWYSIRKSYRNYVDQVKRVKKEIRSIKLTA